MKLCLKCTEWHERNMQKEEKRPNEKRRISADFPKSEALFSPRSLRQSVSPQTSAWSQCLHRDMFSSGTHWRHVLPSDPHCAPHSWRFGFQCQGARWVQMCSYLLDLKILLNCFYPHHQIIIRLCSTLKVKAPADHSTRWHIWQLLIGINDKDLWFHRDEFWH